MKIDDRVKAAFQQVRAEEALKDRTKALLLQRAQGRRGRQALVAVACCLLFLMLGGGWMYMTPTAKISVDINPSLELGINRFDRVVSVEAYNEDGQELARSLDIRFSGYAEAVEKILGSEAVTALLAGGEVAEFTVAESQGAQAQRLLSGLQSCTAGHQNTYCYSVDAQWAQEAHHLSLSCGKYRAFLEVQALYPDITPEEIQGMTMREIRTLLSGAGEEGQAASPPGHGGHGHHGAGHGWGAAN